MDTNQIKFAPMMDYVFVENVEAVSDTLNGGTVLAVGERALLKFVRVGDRIVFANQGRREFWTNGKDASIVRLEDIVGKAIE